MDINNKIAIATDGCSGLDTSTVISLISNGVKVAIFDINKEQCANELGYRLDESLKAS